jgi:hypothetical protein
MAIYQYTGHSYDKSEILRVGKAIYSLVANASSEILVNKQSIRVNI